MDQDERNALTAERTEKQRLYQKSKNTAGYGARAEYLANRINEIDALLDTPEPQPQPEEPSNTESLAGKVLGDPDATPEAKSLAGSVLARAGD